MIQTPMNAKEIKQLMNIIEKQWGCRPELDYAFLLSDKEKLHIICKDAHRLDLQKLNINSIGLYIGELKNNQLRLTIEGSQLIGPHAMKNIVEIRKDTLKLWLKGEDIKAESGEGFIIVKSGNDYFGTGKIKEGWISNYVPKTRRQTMIDVDENETESQNSSQE